MNIEVGDFVRTNDGYLGKLIAINKQDYNYLVIDTTKNVRNDKYPATYLYLKNENIAKHSKNIIDLIGEGDFVNGYKITQIITETNNETKEEKIHLFSGREDTSNKNLIVGHMDSIFEVVTEYEPIKTILTHEQYERNCYRLEE